MKERTKERNITRLEGEGVLIVMPTYNEVVNIAPLLEDIHKILPKVHVLVVDDASPDGTGEVVDKLASKDSRIFTLHRSDKLGLGTAYIQGFKWALEREYNYICEMDADFSHQPKYLTALLEAVGEADLVLGSRYVKQGGVENWTPFRKLLSKGGSIYARTILGVSIMDLTGGFKVFRRRVLEEVDLNSVRSNGYAFQIEMTYRSIVQGFRVKEVPIRFVDRLGGSSKMSWKVFLEGVAMVWWLKLSVRPDTASRE
ncbi:MAG: polyprenol monophosphomannose synthase [Deltaproteobacteria bacterium]|nr:polyprenol monophosphomannose synthase [Deltaproteobacteria bacterium]